MASVTYRIVEHDGGYAYKLGDVYSETFATHDDALAAARDAAQRQETGLTPHAIEYQDASGAWRTEVASDGAHVEIEDEADAADDRDDDTTDPTSADPAGEVFRH